MRFTRIDLAVILVAVVIFAAFGVVAAVNAATSTPPTGQTPAQNSQQPVSIIDASTVYLTESGYCYDVLLSDGQQETWCYRSHGQEHIKSVSGRMA